MPRRFLFGHDPAPVASRDCADEPAPRAVRTTIPLAANAPPVSPTWRQGRGTEPLISSDGAPTVSAVRTRPMLPPPSDSAPVPVLPRHTEPAPTPSRRASVRLGVAMLTAGMMVYAFALWAILSPRPARHSAQAAPTSSAPMGDAPTPSAETPDPPASAPSSAASPSAPRTVPAPPAPHPRRTAPPPHRANGEITNPWGND